MSGPRTTREALVAEILGDLDVLLARAENLPALVAHTEEKLAGTAAALEVACDKYRLAVTAFTEEAKADLTEHYDRKTTEAIQSVTRTSAEQGALLQGAVRQAFRSEAAALGVSRHFRRSMCMRVLEHGVTALVASGLTAGLVYLIVN
jgi:hypothetical protein